MVNFDKAFTRISEELEGTTVTCKDCNHPVIKKFLEFAIKRLKISKTPQFVLDENRDRVTKLKAMAGYAPAEHSVWVYTKNRNIADILRSVAHELVHARQKEKRKNSTIDGSTGSSDENEANAVAGILLREYGKTNPEIYE